MELLAGLAGAVPGAVLGHYAIWGPFGPYPDQMAMLTLITIPAGMVAGAFSGQAIARRVMDRRVMERRARQDSAP